MIMLKNIDTGVIKKAPTGYSWTTFLFGFSLHYLEEI